MNKTTCGPIWYKVLEKVNNEYPSINSRDIIDIFSYGHLVGQAEKISLGACGAAMFRPKDIHNLSFQHRINIIAPIYKLNWLKINNEFWLYNPSIYDFLIRIKDLVRDSPEYHIIRGFLTGVPIDKIDIYFHERKNSDTTA